MNNHVIEFTVYVFFSGLIMLLGWFVLMITMIAIGAAFRWKDFRRKVLKASTFMAFLLLYGAVVNDLWFRIFPNKYYLPKDTLAHFIPILPFGEWTYDPVCGGHLLGATTMQQMQAYWLAFAMPVWAAAFLTVLLLYRKRPTRCCSRPVTLANGLPFKGQK